MKKYLSSEKSTPPKILIHADHGLGKSSLGASALDPIFIQTEDGLSNIDTQAFPLCESYDQFMDQLHQVYAEEHGFKTLCIDSLDWLEKIINKDICAKHNKESISDFGYGAGYTMAYECFSGVIDALDKIRSKRQMSIILIAHSQIATYQNPLGADYDRHKIKLRDKNAELFLEWADMVGFMHFDISVKTEKGGFQEKTKAIGGHNRVVSCYPSAAFVSKNRYGIKNDIIIPDENSGWNKLIEAIKGGSK